MTRQLTEPELAHIVAQAKSYAPKDKDTQSAVTFRLQFSRQRVGLRSFIENFCYIKQADGTIDRITLNSAQRYVMSRFLRQLRKTTPEKGKWWLGRIRAIVQKPRQIGLSTFIECLAFEWLVRGENVSGRVVSHVRENATEILGMLSRMRDQLDERHGVMLPARRDRDDVIAFKKPISGDMLITSAEASNPGRGGTKQFQHLAEVAFYGNSSYRVMNALRILVHNRPGTVLVVESTPFGAGGYFADEWFRACEGISDLEPIFIPWFWVETHRRNTEDDEKRELLKSLNEDERWLLTQVYFRRYHGNVKVDIDQLAWRRWAITNLCGNQIDDFRKEFPATPEEGLSYSGRPVFEHRAVQEALRALRDCEPPLFKGDIAKPDFTNLVSGSTDWNVFVASHREPQWIPDQYGPLLVWKRPVPGLNYCLGGDVAEGVRGGDFSVCYVIEMSTRQMVARWRGRIDPESFAQICWQLSNYYNDGEGMFALTGIEANNHGLSTNSELVRIQHPNVYLRVSPSSIERIPSKKVGWLTTVANRKAVIDHARTDVSQHLTLIRDEALVREMLGFHFDDKGDMVPPAVAPDGQAGHDDCIMAFAITLQMWEIAYQAQAIRSEPIKLMAEHETHWRDVDAELWTDTAEEEKCI